MEIEVMNHAKATFDKMIDLLKQHGDKELDTWYRNTGMKINKKILATKDHFEGVYTICNSFSTTVKFFEKLIDKADSNKKKERLTYQCAVSFFIICIQLGIVDIDDKFVNTKAFNMLMDKHDFLKCTKAEIDAFDYTKACMLIRHNIGEEKIEDTDSLVFGVNTALMLSVSKEELWAS